jgi:hypothetical protein
MNPLDVAPRRAVGSPQNASTPVEATMPPKTDRKHDENPLWTLALVVAFLCGVAALVIAFI